MIFLLICVAFCNRLRVYMSISSISSSPTADSTDCEEMDNGFLRKCRCGGELNLQSIPKGPWSGRLLYSCENEDDGGFHTHKWWDTAVIEEIKTLRLFASTVEDRLRCLTRTPDGTTVSPVMLAARLDYLQNDVMNLCNNVLDHFQKISGGVLSRERITSDIKRDYGYEATRVFGKFCFCFVVVVVGIFIAGYVAGSRR